MNKRQRLMGVAVFGALTVLAASWRVMAADVAYSTGSGHEYAFCVCGTNVAVVVVVGNPAAAYQTGSGHAYASCLGVFKPLGSVFKMR